MKERFFNEYVKKWIWDIAEDDYTVPEPECISIDDIYENDSFRITHSYYQIIIDGSASKSGDTNILNYMCTDLLWLDENNDVETIETIDYQIK